MDDARAEEAENKVNVCVIMRNNTSKKKKRIRKITLRNIMIVFLQGFLSDAKFLSQTPPYSLEIFSLLVVYNTSPPGPPPTFVI